ncbi:zinc-binding dehydrogenase [Micromonospora sp. KC721]|uniref:zinc-binding dehydrogenase n=1 Tax=Micromonospora sp. KC721 TaxID=2530380 RepID=UPI0010468EE4|nr:zinc-binding dehydrogenase [Micromonospora sp. KC721]TDB79822.1 oxidoreductase [Micromonospora sp. KC721]
MRATRQYRFGGARELLYQEDVAEPRPGPGQVRVKVSAAGVSRLDLAVRAGTYRWLPELPMTPGREVAGVVEALGEGVPAGWLGRRVVTCLGLASGGYAELAVREVAALHEIPDGLPEEAAVAAIVTGRAALGVLDVARVTPEDVVLVLGAAGGVGGMLVQMVARTGATVVGAVGGVAKTAIARRLGATFTVNHSQPDWAQRVTAELDGRHVTLVLDGIGGDLGRQAVDLLGYGGGVVVYGWLSGQPAEVSARELYERALSWRAAPGSGLAKRPGGVRMLEERALTAVRDGLMTPLMQRVPLADAAAVHAELESRVTTGKVVLIP